MNARPFLFLLIFALTGALFGCGGAGGGASAGGESAAPGTPSVQVIIETWGESTLSGYGLAPGESVPEQLQAALPGMLVRNEALNGTTAGQQLAGSDGVHRPWSEQVAQSPAGIIIIGRGVNEAYRSIPAQTFRAQLLELVGIAQAAGKRVILQTPPATASGFLLDAGVATMAGVVRELAASMEVPLSDGHEISRRMLAADPAALLDGVHPGPALARALAADLARIVAGLGDA